SAGSCHRLLLPSFPTRRSSDLVAEVRDELAEELPVPLEGEPLPDDAQPRVVERVRDEEDDRQIQIEEDQAAPAAKEQIRELDARSEEHTSELQSRENLVCRLLL